MILAAGRGERMRPLTDHVPKPLLPAGGKPLIVWQIERLAEAGFKEIVINHAHLGQLIEDGLGNGERYGVNLHYSREGEALETAGGIAKALTVLGTAPFLLVNGDVYCELPYSDLVPTLQAMNAMAQTQIAHLVLVDNPEHHPNGDFSLEANNIVGLGEKKLTYSGVGIYRPKMFSDITPGSKAKLAPLLYKHIEQHQIAGEHYRGFWMDVGTPQRLQALDSYLRAFNF